jgi:SnoaL-like domain
MSPADRITAYFLACSEGSADDIAKHFTTDAVVYDTNVRPARTRAAIGVTWVRVREKWLGARWTVDSLVTDGGTAAIEWSMTGVDPTSGHAFVFRGSEHYAFEAGTGLIREIRQYWTFDPAKLDTGLIDYKY